jgi:transposase InsO family protein
MNDLRREFVIKALQRRVSFAALCRQYGISRKTGYKWRQRAQEDGLNLLGERSRRPRRSPRQLSEATTCELIRLKLRHVHWGPKKICGLYARQQGAAPSLSSCKRVLARAGLVEPRRRRVRRDRGQVSLGAVARAPNDVWTVDFKGWWRLADGRRCEPLTVRDAYSRFVFTVRVLPKADTAAVQAEFTRLFQTYGLPRVIRSDNGAPFAASNALLGLSRLSVWWVALGIELDRGRPGHPQDNGGHERLHRDIEAELAGCVEADAARQQAACDLWREEFNWERPHEALEGRCPGQLYRKSARLFPAEPIRLDYGPGFFPRKIGRTGCLRWCKQRVFISTSLMGWEVGLRYRDSDHLEVWLNFLLLGELELSTLCFRGAASRPPEAAQLTA